MIGLRKTIAQTVTSNLYALQGRRTNQDMAYLMNNKSRSTWGERKRNPMTLKLGELVTIAEKTNTPLETLIFGKVDRQ